MTEEVESAASRSNDAGEDHMDVSSSVELKRQDRVVNQMATMHSVLMERYQRLRRAVTILLLLLSVLAAVLAFGAGGERFSILSISAEGDTWLGWFAVLVVILVLAEAVFDLRGREVEYADAVRRLADLRSMYRTVQDDEESKALERLRPLYSSVMESLPHIPEKAFNRLKAFHLQKVAISRYLSAHPGASVREARRAVDRAASTE